MIRMLEIIKLIGACIKNFLGFIDDCKSIMIGVFTCIMAICILADIIKSNGSNIGMILIAYGVGISKLY